MLSLQSGKYKGMTVTLRRNEVGTAERQLGVRLAMSGHDDDEYAYRLEQFKTLAGKNHSSPFSRLDAETIYRERWLSSVGYCLPITQFDVKQCKAIQSPFLNAILPKMGFNRHFPRAVVFGPKCYQGKGLDDYEVKQYTSHLTRFVGYLQMEGNIGNLL